MTSDASANPSCLLPIGQPIQFTSGEFAGQTIRASLREVQKADLGRKYARVDRRPLDPPPCVWLRLYQVVNSGTNKATEVEIENYGDIRNLGILCHVDLFPVPDELRAEPAVSAPSRPSLFYSPPTVSHQIPPREYRENRMSPGNYPSRSQYLPPTPENQDSARRSAESDSSSWSPSDIVSYYKGHPIRENSKMTSALVGGSCVEASRVHYLGKEAFMFVFSDLAVSVEGTFILRYRAFDIFSRTSRRPDLYSIQAECYGGSFRVYSTKDFPGLQPSTELSKTFARWGVRINIREKPRRRGKSDESGGLLEPEDHSEEETYGNDYINHPKR